MKPERDPETGWMTTGHEWNGITELNTPVPKPVWFFLIVTALFALGYWLLMPAFPLGSTFTKGLLGADDRAAVTAAVKEATAERAGWTGEVMAKSYAEVERDPRLMAAVRETGRTLFGDNCSVCHGREAKGGRGFPNLTGSSFLWGNSPEAIAETIQVGINSANPKSRVSQMPAFGRDHVLERPDIENVVAYVMSLSGAKASVGNVEAGKTAFTANCAVCHGPDGKGKTDVGAPNLSDQIWIRGGGEEASIYDFVWGGLQGQMPSWEGRLSPLDLKILTLYVVDLGKQRP
ncbi:cytochrome c oxidase cbb3-type subunit 3 [Rhodospirillales bacterium URHD0017]|nr:cytochrome c oxidase cbb3-type subunit 3 [Rhodospirillales bacterium URHD0017]